MPHPAAMPRRFSGAVLSLIGAVPTRMGGGESSHVGTPLSGAGQVGATTGRRHSKAWVGGLALLIVQVATAAAAEPAPTPRFPPPVTPACISSPFGPRVLAGRPLAGTFHPGIDLPAAEGAPVHAIAPGQVIRAQRHGPGGLEMLVQHDGFIGVYSHLGHVAPVIAEGRRAVTTGQMIGTIGRSGVTYGTHLYFGILVGGKPVDPAPWFDLPPCGQRQAGTPARSATTPATSGTVPARAATTPAPTGTDAAPSGTDPTPSGTDPVPSAAAGSGKNLAGR